jgi:5'-3' exonuclease
MLLNVKNLYMLRHNQQTSETAGRNIYDLIDVKMLKENISYYINRQPGQAKCFDMKQQNKTFCFDTNNINYDLVCISTLFGNDFIPKIETINVKKGFQNIK